MNQERDDLIARVMASPPVDTSYVLGLWHPDRATWRGYWVEAKVAAKRALVEPNQGVKKFLILGRARSGTTLLTELLNTNPNLTCDLEVLAKTVVSPFRYLENLAAKSQTAAYGAKLLSYQMVQVQCFKDPIGFLERLNGAGYRLIHLKRGTFAQTLSLEIAHQSMLYHQRKSSGKAESIRFDPEDFCNWLEWNVMMEEYEDRCLRDLPHLSLSYERDLLDQNEQQAAADRVFEWVGVPSAKVSTRLKKILPSKPSEILENYDDIVARMDARGLGHLKPE